MFMPHHLLNDSKDMRIYGPVSDCPLETHYYLKVMNLLSTKSMQALETDIGRQTAD